jgi:hypothetical protein
MPKNWLMYFSALAYKTPASHLLFLGRDGETSGSLKGRHSASPGRSPGETGEGKEMHPDVSAVAPWRRRKGCNSSAVGRKECDPYRVGEWGKASPDPARCAGLMNATPSGSKTEKMKTPTGRRKVARDGANLYYYFDPSVSGGVSLNNRAGVAQQPPGCYCSPVEQGGNCACGT